MLTKFIIIESFKSQKEEMKTNYLNKLSKIIKADTRNSKSKEKGGTLT